MPLGYNVKEDLPYKKSSPPGTCVRMVGWGYIFFHLDDPGWGMPLVFHGQVKMLNTLHWKDNPLVEKHWSLLTLGSLPV